MLLLNIPRIFPHLYSDMLAASFAGCDDAKAIIIYHPTRILRRTRWVGGWVGEHKKIPGRMHKVTESAWCHLFFLEQIIGSHAFLV